DSTRQHLQLASFLAKQGKGADAAWQVRVSGGPQAAAERTILHEVISTLLAAEQFSDAYSAWAATHHVTINNSAKDSALLLNGNFLEPIVRDDPGFGWQVTTNPGVSLSIDPGGPS